MYMVNTWLHAWTHQCVHESKQHGMKWCSTDAIEQYEVKQIVMRQQAGTAPGLGCFTDAGPGHDFAESCPRCGDQVGYIKLCSSS